MNDISIVDLYFGRDEEAITQTDKKYGRYCYSITYNILTNRNDAEESVKDYIFGSVEINSTSLPFCSGYFPWINYPPYFH